MSERWEHFEAALRERAYAAIDHDPQVLLEEDGGPLGQTADVILARLIGFDDEIVHDGWRLRRVEPVLLAVESTEVVPSMTAATYRLQSSYVRTRASAMNGMPPDVTPGPDATFDVLYLRYRRRS